MKRDVAVDIRERVAGTVTVLEPLGRMVLSESPADDVLKERVAAYIAVRKQQGRIVLVNPSGRVRELLRVTRLVLKPATAEQNAVSQRSKVSMFAF